MSHHDFRFWRWPHIRTVFVILAVLLIVFPLAAAAQNSGTITAAEDTYVSGIKPDMNFGSKPHLHVGPGAESTTVIQFGLPPDVGREVASAKLVLNIIDVWKGGVVRAHRVLTPWSETDVTYNTQPSTIGFGPVTVERSYSSIEIDVTDEVNRWLSGAANYGIAIVSTDGLDPAASVLFHSKESTSGRGPTLIIDDVVYREFASGFEGLREVFPYTTMNLSGLCGFPNWGGGTICDDCEQYDWTALGGTFSVDNNNLLPEWINGANPACEALRTSYEPTLLAGPAPRAPFVPIRSRPAEATITWNGVTRTVPGWSLEIMNVSPCNIRASIRGYVYCRGELKGNQ